MTLACVLWNVGLQPRLGFADLTEQYLALQLGLAICIAFIGSHSARAETEAPGVGNGLVTAVGLAPLRYTAVAHGDLLMRGQPLGPPVLTVIGALQYYKEAGIAVGG